MFDEYDNVDDTSMHVCDYDNALSERDFECAADVARIVSTEMLARRDYVAYKLWRYAEQSCKALARR
jgi:hypothetical protein